MSKILLNTKVSPNQHLLNPDIGQFSLSQSLKLTFQGRNIRMSPQFPVQIIETPPTQGDFHPLPIINRAIIGLESYGGGYGIRPAATSAYKI